MENITCDCCCHTPKYRGVKIVEAYKMDEATAIKSGFARANADNHEYGEGYHVTYPDGYESWSPKDVFEKSYRCIDSFRDRLIIERDELNEKLRNLIKFLDDVNKAEAPSLEGRDIELMNFQRKMMQNYLDILNERIGRAF